jgi:hypothetical protein
MACEVFGERSGHTAGSHSNFAQTRPRYGTLEQAGEAASDPGSQKAAVLLLVTIMVMEGSRPQCDGYSVSSPISGGGSPVVGHSGAEPLRAL